MKRFILFTSLFVMGCFLFHSCSKKQQGNPKRYQIDSAGRFVKLSEKKYKANTYLRSEPNNNDKNIWDGTEVLL